MKKKSLDTLRGKIQAILEGRLEPPAILKTLGMNVVRFGGGKAALTMHVDERFHNPMGTLHGGIMTDLADASIGVALMSTLEGDESFTTIDLRINFLRAVYESDLTAESTVVRRGRTIALVESVVKDQEGREIARASATQMILHPKP